ncbi:MAG: FhaA domain-containing protein [Anaerolineales bacterium]
MQKASDELQKLLQNWLEQTLLPVLREGSLLAPIAAEQMTDEINQLARTDEAGQVFAPDQFTITIHPDATVGLGSSLADIHDSLSQSLEDILRDTGYRFRRRLHVTLATDPTLEVGAVKVIAWHSKDPLNVTKELSPKQLGDRSAMPADAFLMVEGRRHFPLERSEVRIGRLLENDLVLKDPHVSRRHALLRLEKGQYVLYDLRSTAGTKVNGKAVLSQALYPGDVIEVASVEMVYGEGAEMPPSKSASYAPPSEEVEKQGDVTPLDLKKFDFPTRSFGKTDVEPEESNNEDKSE